MQTHGHKLWLRRLLALAPLVLFATGCVNALVGDGDKCTDGKKNYAPGESYLAEDGCNSCTCEKDGTPSCTDKACDPGDGSWPNDASAVDGCSYQGKVIPLGEKFMGECGGYCYCDMNGKVDCAGSGCSSDGGVPSVSDASLPNGCTYGKDFYKPGTTFVAADGCKCQCGKDGKVDCFGCGVTDAGPAPSDASLPICKYEGREVSGTFYGGDCNLCTCDAKGQVSCNKNTCGPGYCKYNGVDYVVGAPVMSANACGGGCYCIADQKIWCDTADCPLPTDAGTSQPGTCDYNGKPQPVGAWFPSADGCNKCQCVKEGYVECSMEKCPDPTCRLGVDTFYSGQKVVCADGCNICTCSASGWSTTDIACSALPAISACPADLDVGAFLASVVYLEGNSIAVSESRCVNGQTRDFQLCYDPVPATFSSEGYFLYVYSTGATRSCNAERTERVFSLTPLRDAYFTAHPNEMFGKIGLRSNGRYESYGFMR